MKQTENLRLNKPDAVDYVLIEKLNENADILEDLFGEFKGSKPLTEELLNKLNSLKNYTHPKSHSLDMIDETEELKIFTKGEREKLRDLNNFALPDAIPGSKITQDSKRRFVSDEEKKKWNEIADLKGPREIGRSEDLDDYKEPGYYISKEDSISLTLVNSPCEISFSLTVITVGVDKFVQLVVDREGTFYVRAFNGVFSNWLQIPNLDQITKADVGLDQVINVKQASDRDFQAHLKDELPHRWRNADGSYTRYGFKAVNGNLEFRMRKEW